MTRWAQLGCDAAAGLGAHVDYGRSHRGIGNPLGESPGGGRQSTPGAGLCPRGGDLGHNQSPGCAGVGACCRHQATHAASAATCGLGPTPVSGGHADGRKESPAPTARARPPETPASTYHLADQGIGADGAGADSVDSAESGLPSLPQ